MKLKRTLIAAAIAATFGLAGTAQAQVSDGVIKIGIMNDMSSLYSDIAGPGSVVAARMAIEDFGAAKKGMKVEVLSADHQNKPDVGSQIANQWYDVDKVDAIFDVPTSSVALAINEITKKKGKAFLVSGAATSDLTGKACSPNTIHWTYDTWMLANGTGSAIVKTGGDSWFFITADYAFGHALERDTEAVVLKGGGKVLGKVRHPLNAQDFSSFLLQAQSSKAKIIGLANAGGDTINSIKQASEFGIVKDGQSLAGMLVFISDIHGLGLDKQLVLLGFQRRDPRVVAQVHRAPRQEIHAQRYAGRRLRRADALSESGRQGRRRRRWRGGRQSHEGDADRRSAVRQGQHPQGRPQAPPGLPGRSEEALGVERALRLLQGARHDPGGPGFPSGEGRRLHSVAIAVC